MNLGPATIRIPSQGGAQRRSSWPPWRSNGIEQGMGEEKGPGEEGKGVFMGCWVDFQCSLQRSFDILPWALRLF